MISVPRSLLTNLLVSNCLASSQLFCPSFIGTCYPLIPVSTCLCLPLTKTLFITECLSTIKDQRFPLHQEYLFVSLTIVLLTLRMHVKV